MFEYPPQSGLMFTPHNPRPSPEEWRKFLKEVAPELLVPENDSDKLENVDGREER